MLKEKGPRGLKVLFWKLRGSWENFWKNFVTFAHSSKGQEHGIFSPFFDVTLKMIKINSIFLGEIIKLFSQKLSVSTCFILKFEKLLLVKSSGTLFIIYNISCQIQKISVWFSTKINFSVSMNNKKSWLSSKV